MNEREKVVDVSATETRSDHSTLLATDRRRIVSGRARIRAGQGGNQPAPRQIVLSGSGEVYDL